VQKKFFLRGGVKKARIKNPESGKRDRPVSTWGGGEHGENTIKANVGDLKPGDGPGLPKRICISHEAGACVQFRGFPEFGEGNPSEVGRGNNMKRHS